MVYAYTHEESEDSPIEEVVTVYTATDYPLCRLLLNYEYTTLFNVGELVGKAWVGYTMFRSFCYPGELDTLKALWYAGVIETDGAIAPPYPDDYNFGDPAS